MNEKLNKDQDIIHASTRMVFLSYEGAVSFPGAHHKASEWRRKAVTTQPSLPSHPVAHTLHAPPCQIARYFLKPSEFFYNPIQAVAYAPPSFEHSLPYMQLGIFFFETNQTHVPTFLQLSLPSLVFALGRAGHCILRAQA